MTNETQTAKTARIFLRKQRNGILSTISTEVAGYPFGSVCPYLLTHEGCPIILVSTIAQHTRNIIANNKVCLTVMDETLLHRLEGARVSLIGEAVKMSSAKTALIKRRFLNFFPESITYFTAHDFEYYQINPVRLRYIEGFGKIFWVEKSDYLLPESALTEAEQKMIDHMNTDHPESIRKYCQNYTGLPPAKAQIIGIDPEGFDVRTETEDLYFTFSCPCASAEDVRKEMIRMSAGTSIKDAL